MPDLFLLLLGKLNKRIDEHWPSARKVVIAVAHVGRNKKRKEEVPSVGRNSALLFLLQKLNPQRNTGVLVLEEQRPISKKSMLTCSSNNGLTRLQYQLLKSE